MNTSFGNVQEKQPVPAATYDVMIDNAEQHVSRESQKPSIKVTVSIEGEPDAPKISHYIPLPNQDDDEQKTSNKMIGIKRFLVAFGIPFEDNGFNIEDFFGARATVPLTLTDPDEPGANGNVYNRLNLPRLPDENPVRKAASKKG